MLGGEAQVPTITGSVRLKIPETTQSGQVFRLKGHGMPVVGKPDTRGDLYATVDIQLPRSLTKEQRQHYEALVRKLDEPKVNVMNINKYTEKAQEAILAAQQLAEREGHPEILPEHLLLTLLEQHDGIVPEIVRKMNAGSVGAGGGGAGRARTGCRARTAARRSASPRACGRS